MQPSVSWIKVVHGACCDAERLQQIVLAELGRTSVLRILGGAPRGDARTYWSRVGGCLGPSADLSGYGAETDWVEGGFEPNGRAASRGGDAAQPLHNDEASAPDLSGAVALLLVERQGAGAGPMLLADAGLVADCARRRDPGLYDQLFSVAIRFGGASGEQRVTPILRREGDRLKIAWNEYRVLPEQSEAAHQLRGRFRLFLQDMVLSGDAAAVPLQTGDALFFRADEVLHGRELAGVRQVVTPVLAKTYFARTSAAATRAA
jgi:hypothetical protein